MKKLINDPFDFVEEMLDGFCLAHDDQIKNLYTNHTFASEFKRQAVCT